MASALVSPAVVTAFKECLKAFEDLRTIDDLFMDLGFAFDAELEEEESHRSGQRRSRAAGYLGTLDLTRAADARKLLNAIGLKLADWQEGNQDTVVFHRLLLALRSSHISWDGRRLTSTAGPLDTHNAILANFSAATVDEEAVRILANIDSDPAAAITAARALVEASCKAVLERLDEPINDKDELPTLYKKTAAALRIDPTQHEQAIYKQTLQGLVSTVQGLAEVRNTFSSAHGKHSRAVRPAPRHARLAAGAAWTIAAFLAETLAERTGKT